MIFIKKLAEKESVIRNISAIIISILLFALTLILCFCFISPKIRISDDYKWHYDRDILKDKVLSELADDYILDNADILSNKTEKQIKIMNANFKKNCGGMIAVVTTHYTTDASKVATDCLDNLDFLVDGHDAVLFIHEHDKSCLLVKKSLPSKIELAADGESSSDNGADEEQNPSFDTNDLDFFVMDPHTVDSCTKAYFEKQDFDGGVCNLFSFLWADVVAKVNQLIARTPTNVSLGN